MNEYSTVVGIDLGDKQSLFTALDSVSSDVVQAGSARTMKAGLTRTPSAWEPSLCAVVRIAALFNSAARSPCALSRSTEMLAQRASSGRQEGAEFPDSRVMCRKKPR